MCPSVLFGVVVGCPLVNLEVSDPLANLEVFDSTGTLGFRRPSPFHPPEVAEHRVARS